MPIALLRGNRIGAGASEGLGIYVWGNSRSNPQPSKNITIEDNVLELRGQPICLNGVRHAIVRGNVVRGSKAASVVELKRSAQVTLESDGPRGNR